MKMGQIMNKLNKRAVILICIAIVILIIVIFDRLSFSPLPATFRDMDEELSLKKGLFLKYNTAISRKGSYEKKLNKLRTSYESIESKLFLNKTEDLAQAKLQEFIKSAARRSGLNVSGSSAQKGEIISEDPHLMLVYAKIEIADIDRIKKLQDFLYNLEYEKEKLLFIDDLKIRGVGFDNTSGVSATIMLSAIARLKTKT